MRTTTDIDLWGETQRRRLVRLCAAISRDWDAAEDLAQETLLEAWRNGAKLFDPSGADRWLAAIARNVCRRWVRTKGRDAERAAALEAGGRNEVDLESDLSRTELAELVERAFDELTPQSRDVLTARYVDDLPTAEIAERLGISEDAVTMRLSRGRAALARHLAIDLGREDGGWAETRLWCAGCGRSRLSMRRQGSPETIAFRCARCQEDPAGLDSEFSLDNPLFERLFGRLKQPAAIRARTRDWCADYYRRSVEEDHVDCSRCGEPVRLGPLVRPGGVLGAFARCDACGEQVWLSVDGIALGLPDMRRFVRERKRVFALPPRDVEIAGQPARLVGYADLFGSARAEVAFSRETLRVLEVRAA